MRFRSAAVVAFAFCAMLALAGDPPAPVKDAETARIEYLQAFSPPFEKPATVAEFISNQRMLRSFYESPRAHVAGVIDEARREYLLSLSFDEFKSFATRGEKEAVLHRFTLEMKSPMREDLAAMGYSTARQAEVVRKIAGPADTNFDFALGAVMLDVDEFVGDQDEAFDKALGLVRATQFLVSQNHIARKSGADKAEGAQVYPPISELWPFVKSCGERLAADARSAGYPEEKVSQLEQMLAMSPEEGAAKSPNAATEAKTTPQSTSSEEETPNVHPSR